MLTVYRVLIYLYITVTSFINLATLAGPELTPAPAQVSATAMCDWRYLIYVEVGAAEWNECRTGAVDFLVLLKILFSIFELSLNFLSLNFL